MRFRRSKLILLWIFTVILFGSALGQEKPRRIGSIDFYGYAGLNLDQVRAALPLHVNDPYPGPAETLERITKAVTSVIGRPPTDIDPVCCNRDGNYILFVGLPGASITETKLNPVPTGKLQLPPEVIQLYKETMDASMASVLDGNAREDTSRGYALSTTDSRLRAKQEAIHEYATKHEKLIRDVLATSSEPEQRIAAAHFLGYANQSKTQLTDLVRASRDANDIVRNNATRALGVLAESSPKVAAQIPAGPFIEMLNSGSWSDRNKGGWVLESLTKSRDAKLLAQLRSEALTSLIEMARWHSSGHAYTARILLGRIAGIEEERLRKLASRDSADEIINALQIADSISLDVPDKLKLLNVKTETVTFKGRKALRVLDAAPPKTGDEGRLVVLSNTDFQEGTIEVDLAGELAPGASDTARGFVGIAFRVAADASRFECIYLRPTNGRAEDQLRRNHSVQYISIPGFPWELLRKEFPGKYETYVDLIPGEWTRVRIEVRGKGARLFVNGVGQPTFLVDELKQGQTRGAVALWIGPGTLAHFANLRISP